VTESHELVFDMSELPVLLKASLSPDTRKQAESNLTLLSGHPGFLSHLLRLILDNVEERAVRLSGGVFLKNIVKTRWEEVCLICY
jgi:exportin-2 (importin alpha re-exporter)